MHTFTHLAISRIIQKKVERKLPVRLDTVSFMLGNIKPDIYPDLVKIPHFKEDSMEFIRAEIRRLLDLKIDKFPKCTRQFSVRLGVISHYLSDFFCRAHIKTSMLNMFQHYMYEKRLSQYCKKNSGAVGSFDYAAHASVKHDFSRICEDIDLQHHEYLKSIPSYSLDMNYALRICISLSISVITACMAEEIEIAA